jgi:hypothetical protein
LCRATLVESLNSSSTARGSGTEDTPLAPEGGGVAANTDGGVGQRIAAAGGERALFRFSTEGILPVWLPVPAFSFEVVRRPPFPQEQQQTPVQQVQPAEVHPGDEEGAHADIGEQALNPPFDQENELLARRQAQEQEQAGEPSFLRRLLVLAGAIPMSPEEEARALGQLVDMFPQYDRSDLLRELRDRGSAEAVAEAILMGIFSGIPRGDS